MKRQILLLLVILFMDTWLSADARGGRGGGSRSSSSSKSRTSSGGSSGSKTGVFGWLFGGSSKSTSSSTASKASQPSSNIGPGGYPVQPGLQAKPALSPPYTPSANAKPPPYSAQLPNGHSIYNPTKSINPPAYSPMNTHSAFPTSNHYHYSSPSGSNYQGVSFGYPGGGYHNTGYQPRYNGMGLYSSGRGSYGYSGSGNWGVPSYGAGVSGNTNDGFWKGAAVGYMTNSLLNRFSNPWGYRGYGYGHGYMGGYRDYSRHQEMASSTPATPIESQPLTPSGSKWTNCIAFDEASNSTLINPSCTCTVVVGTDLITGEEQSYHDCTRNVPAKERPAQEASWATGVTIIEAQRDHPNPTEAKRKEFFSQLEQIVNMGNFVN